MVKEREVDYPPCHHKQYKTDPASLFFLGHDAKENKDDPSDGVNMDTRRKQETLKRKKKNENILSSTYTTQRESENERNDNKETFKTDAEDQKEDEGKTKGRRRQTKTDKRDKRDKRERDRQADRQTERETAKMDRQRDSKERNDSK